VQRSLTIVDLDAMSIVHHPIDYKSENPVILSVDSSSVAAGFILSQIDDNGKCRPARYGLLPMSEREV
jgi:hypothetical protein